MLKETNELEVFQNENWGWGACNMGALGHMDVSVVGAQVMKKAAFLTLVSLTIGGCITDTGEQPPEPRPVSVYSIKSLTIRRQAAHFVVCCTIPEPCWAFVRSDYSISGRSIAVTIYARRLNNDPCLQVLSSLDAPATIVVPSSGTYTVKFWRWGGRTLDTTLTIQ